jgi:hypothetical protein
LITIIVVDTKQMVAIKVSRYGVSPEMVDLNDMVLMHTKVKTSLM